MHSNTPIEITRRGCLKGLLGGLGVIALGALGFQQLVHQSKRDVAEFHKLIERIVTQQPVMDLIASFNFQQRRFLTELAVESFSDTTKIAKLIELEGKFVMAKIVALLDPQRYLKQVSPTIDSMVSELANGLAELAEKGVGAIVNGVSYLNKICYLLEPRHQTQFALAIESLEKRFGELHSKKLLQLLDSQMKDLEKLSGKNNAQMVGAIDRDESGLTENIRKILKEKFGSSFGDEQLFVNIQGPDGNFSKWELRPLYFEDNLGQLTFTSPDGSLCTYLEPADFIKIMKNAASTKVIYDLAAAEAAAELRTAPNLRAYDLPKDQVTHVLRFVSTLRDPTSVISDDICFSMLRGAALKERYANSIEIHSMVLCNDLTISLRERIEAVRRQSPAARSFYIEINSHGQIDGLNFSTKTTMKDLLEVCDSYPDAVFCFSTSACYGGGLRNDLLKACEGSPDLGKRAQLLVQTRPNQVNCGLSSVNLPDFFPCTAYDLFFTSALIDKSVSTIGAAASIADHKAKLFMGMDAEAVINGSLVTRTNRSRITNPKLYFG